MYDVIRLLPWYQLCVTQLQLGKCQMYLMAVGIYDRHKTSSILNHVHFHLVYVLCPNTHHNKMAVVYSWLLMCSRHAFQLPSSYRTLSEPSFCSILPDFFSHSSAEHCRATSYSSQLTPNRAAVCSFTYMHGTCAVNFNGYIQH